MSTYHKILLGLIAVAYAISLIDLIPDLFVPYLGWIDDTFVAGLIFYYLKYGRLPDILNRIVRAAFQKRAKRAAESERFSRESGRHFSFEKNRRKSSSGSSGNTARKSNGEKSGEEPGKRFYNNTGQSYANTENRKKETGSSGRNSGGSGNESSGKRGGSTGNTKSKRSPYEVLGISPGASREEIIAAYRRGVKQYHPDRVAHLGKEFQDLANLKFIEIKEAYNTLIKN